MESGEPEVQRRDDSIDLNDLLVDLRLQIGS